MALSIPAGAVASRRTTRPAIAEETFTRAGLPDPPGPSAPIAPAAAEES